MPEEKISLLESIGQAFGFVSKRKQSPLLPSVVTQRDDYDGAIEIGSSATGIYGHYIDIDGKLGSDFETITRYREIALEPEVDIALADIVNETIIIDNFDNPIELNLDDIEYSDKIKKTILDEFEYIVKLLNFNNKGHDIFKQWYVDGRLYYHTIIDEKSPKKGILELRNIDPRKIKKVREIEKEKASNGVEIIAGIEEYYLFSAMGFGQDHHGNMGSSSYGMSETIRITPDVITYVTSGVLDSNNVMVLSHLHKAIKPLNQLRMLEDSVVIYRLARAPERRIFSVDVGNLPKTKAEEYLASIMNKYKNKMVYDIVTGEVRDDKRHMSMLEDYWIPVRDGKGTTITTLQSGQNLGEMSDVDYFQKKLMNALNVPYSRLESSNQWTLGRATEITRDEVRFNRFIERLRNRFNDLFDELLEKQLILKGIISVGDWDKIKANIKYTYNKDSYFSEMKDIELMKERFNMLSLVDQYSTTAAAGEAKRPYISQEWILKNVLQQSDEDIKLLNKEINTELDEIKKVAPAPEDGGPAERPEATKKKNDYEAEDNLPDEGEGGK